MRPGHNSRPFHREGDAAKEKKIGRRTRLHSLTGRGKVNRDFFFWRITQGGGGAYRRQTPGLGFEEDTELPGPPVKTLSLFGFLFRKAKLEIGRVPRPARQELDQEMELVGKYEKGLTRWFYVALCAPYIGNC